MRVKVSREFADKFTHQMYKPGAVIEVADARAKDLIDRELALAVNVPSPKEVAKVEKAVKPAAKKVTKKKEAK